MRPTLKLTVLAAIVITSLSACAKPSPSITVFSGGNSVHAEADCWTHDGTAAIGSDGCTQEQLANKVAVGGITTLAITPGKTLGISVDSEVAEAGWTPTVLVDGQAQALENAVIHKRYWSMTFPESTHGSFPAGGYILQVTANGTAAGSQRGLWLFALTDAKTTKNA